MIHLPKHIEAQGYECIIASTIMVCMYWRINEPDLGWIISNNLDNSEWNSVYLKGIKKIKGPGMPFNSIKRFLRDLAFPLTSRLEYLFDYTQLTRCVNYFIPPIVIYDRYHMLRGIQREPYHASVIVDKTQETLTAVDPALSPKFITSLPLKDFSESWSLIKNATIIITPKRTSLRRRKRPTSTLDRWVS